MNQQELLRRITSLSNRSHIPHCSIAEEAKKLKLDGETLEIQNGSLTFTGPVLGTNITPTNSMDIAELRTLMDTRMPFIKYDTLEEIMTNWRSIPYPSIVFADDGPESYTSTIVIKQNGARCLCISTKKTIGDYIWLKFQGTDGRDMWSNSSPWRKIPVLDTTDNIICNNVKSDNEDRIKALESKLNNMLDMIHPIGSIYRSKSSIPPDTLFGGTWEDITEVNDGNIGTSISNDYTWYRAA